MASPDTVTLAVFGPYAGELSWVRMQYRAGARPGLRRQATDVIVRLTAWQSVAEALQWSITDDVAGGVYRPADVALWRKVEARTLKLAKLAMP